MAAASTKRGRPSENRDHRIHFCLSDEELDLLRQMRDADFMPSVSAVLRSLLLREAQKRELRPRETARETK